VASPGLTYRRGLSFGLLLATFPAMHLINQSAVPVVKQKSPKGTFELARQHISLALGGIKDVGEWGGGHPFDIERTILPPGKKNFPYHSHAAQFEYYIVISGQGKAKDETGQLRPITAGDHFYCPPGEAHQIINDSSADLEYFVIADHHRADVSAYPGTDKRMIKPEYKVIRLTEADYYEGQE
jgi:uncharacterized cupin superfamily protein